MIDRPRKSIRDLLIEGTAIDDAFGRAVEQAVTRHKKLGQSIVVWENGRIVRVPAEQIELPLTERDETRRS